jgi:hypothetical protein
VDDWAEMLLTMMYSCSQRPEERELMKSLPLTSRQILDEAQRIA